jgi:nucleotide-binding universal stress UspA family protein
MTTAQFESSVSAIVDRSTLQGRSFATMMVHVDVARDCEQRIQLALALADRFEATLIGVAGLALRPAFAAGGVVVYREPTEDDCRAVSARLDEMGRRFQAKGQHLKQVEWRTALELPYELVSREARATDLIIVGARQGGGASVHELVDPGAILLRAGRPVLVAPEVVTPPQLRRVVVAWKETRECRRAVRDAVPFLQRAKDVLILGIDEGQSETAKKHLSDVAGYLRRHGVVVAREVWRQPRGPVAAELLHLVRDEGADLIVAGGYGHSRLGEWIFGGVTHELLASTPVCCLLSH